MLHPRKDYQRIQDPAGLIPEDEPVFLLRAQDKLAKYVVRYWADLNDQYGGDTKLSQTARDHADKMDAWLVKKLADLPSEQPAENQQQGNQEPRPEETLPNPKDEIIMRHAKRLSSNIARRDQVIASANLFADWIKIELSKALCCTFSKVPEALADYLGFPEKQNQENDTEEKKPEN